MTSTTTTTIRKSYGNRKLNSYFPEDYMRLVKQKNSASLPKKSEDVAKLIKYIDDSVIGKNNAFLGPFGRRKAVFCDYAASGRSLQFIEEYILREVLPCYGNTHSTTNITSLQTTLFRHEAREIIKTAVNATEEDAVIFAGHGCMDALKKLVIGLELNEAPIIFIGSNEHQDIFEIWQEYGAQFIRIGETKQNYLDLDDLRDQLKLYQNSGKLMIGCFSAISNVTGIITDDIACTTLLHEFSALSFWDYNLAASHYAVNMNPKVPGVEDKVVSKDAIYFSGHKFVGGVQTPGILVAKKTLFKTINTCEQDGFFTNSEQNKSFELQEEGTTAAVVESVRAGLVMQLKETVTTNYIIQRQERITKQMLQHIRTIPEIILLGNPSSTIKRIPVFSFMVRHPRGTYLHHNFICAVLNDVFGIQARGGCSCSGLYAQDLLGIDQNLADQYENIILEDRRLSSLNLSSEISYLELLRPGYTRISLPYFISDNELAFVMEAVKMVATEGWKLLPQYVVDLDTGEWRHHTNAITKDRKWLGSIRYIDGKMTMNERRISGPGSFPQSYSECLQTARNLFNRARKTALRHPYADQSVRFDNRCDKLRWFMTQQEAQDMLTKNSQSVKQIVPFDPTKSVISKKNEHKEDKGSSSKAPQSNNSSPRHYSLPAIDDPRVIGCSSPLPYLLQDYNGLYYTTPFTQSPVNFAVGETVRSATILNPTISTAPPLTFRERCFSLGAPNVSPPVLSPQTRVSLGINQQARQRNCSCSSQTDLHSLDSDLNMSPTHSLNILSTSSFDCSQIGRASPLPDLQYVTEMTKELATNIKSEIRGVISKVEDALESNDTTDSSSNNVHVYEKQGSGSDDGRSDSISANDIAEYLEKVSKEMANEVKSEIRDVVSAVDVYFTPDRRSYSRASSTGESEKCTKFDKYEHYTPGSSSETVVQMINKSNSTNRLSDEENSSDKSYKNKLLTSTVTSLSSQDSGINLSFHEQETQDYANRRSSSTESCTSKQFSDKLKSTLEIHSESSDNSEQEKSNSSEDNNVGIKWICPPKNIWQSCVEAIDEYEMIRNGDKVMVCLSGGKDSLSLLHTLLQYQSIAQSKGVIFTIGAVTINPDIAGCDPLILLPHLKSIGVDYIIEDHNQIAQQRGRDGGECKQPTENYYTFCTPEVRHRLYSVAKSSEYNVLAIGQHLDDLCENFLLSLFHTGKLRTLRAHYRIKDLDDLRIIRPFIYVREKAIRQFVTSQNLPAMLNSAICPEITKQRQRARQLLAQHEILFPKLFTSLKNALHPLIGFHFDNNGDNASNVDNDGKSDNLNGGDIKSTKRSKSKDIDNITNGKAATDDGSDPETEEEPVLTIKHD